MRFSVVIPIYNVEKYLAQCVESVLNQTFTDFELILVDDGSPDSCPEICDELAKKDNRIKVIHKKNGGLSDARNTGIDAAQGEYLIFIDSDDYLASNVVFETVSNEIDLKKVDIVQYHRIWYFEKTDSYVERENIDTEKYQNLSKEEMIVSLIKNKMVYFSACQNVIARSFIVNNNLYFRRGIKSEDIDWGFRVYSCVPSISLLPYSFYMYRSNREGSITSTIGYKHLIDYCGLLERTVEIVENGNENIKNALMSHCMYHVLICAANNKTLSAPKQEKKEIANRLKALCKGRMGKYTMDSRVKFASKIYRFFGFSIMAGVLGIYLNRRSKTSHSFKTKNVKL